MSRGNAPFSAVDEAAIKAIAAATVPAAIHPQGLAFAGATAVVVPFAGAAAAFQFVAPLTEELVSVSSAVRSSRAVW